VLSPIADYTLQYDNGQNRVARLTGIGGNTMTKSFQYDALGRLTNETNGSTPATFNYDLAGNLGGANVSFNQTNQLPSSFATYDLDGNTLTKNIGGTGIYTYDSAGHVLTQKNGPNSPAITYAYDNMGHRVKRTVNGVSTFYVFAGDTLIGETDASGKPSVRG
jgi:YD repeat-containing protein